MNSPDYDSSYYLTTNNSHSGLPFLHSSGTIITCTSITEFIHYLSYGRDIFTLLFRRNDKQEALPAIYHCLREAYLDPLFVIFNANRSLQQKTPLLAYFCALNWDHIEEPQRFIQELINHPDVEVNAKDQEGVTAFEYLLRKKERLEFTPSFWECVYLFIKKGVDLTIESSTGLALCAMIEVNAGCPLKASQYVEVRHYFQISLLLAKQLSRNINENNVIYNAQKQLIVDYAILERQLNQYRYKPKPKTQISCLDECDFLERIRNLPKELDEYSFGNEESALAFSIRKEYIKGLVEALRRHKRENYLIHNEENLLALVCTHNRQHPHLSLILETLIYAGALVKRKNSDTPSAIEILLRHSLTEITWKALHLLIKAGEQVEASYKGETPFDLLRRQGISLYSMENEPLEKIQKLEIQIALNPYKLQEDQNTQFVRLQARLANYIKGEEERLRERDRRMRFQKEPENCPPFEPPFENNLTPSHLFGLKARQKFKLQTITYDEIITPEHEKIIEGIELYIIKRFTGHLDFKLVEIIEILSGQRQICNNFLSPTNAREYLFLLKLLEYTIARYNRNRHELTKRLHPFDYLEWIVHPEKIPQQTTPEPFTFPVSSFLLRQEILRAASPYMTTAEAFTKTFDHRKIRDRAFLQNQANWIPERTGMHLKLIANQLIQIAHKARFQDKTETIYTAVRGGTAVGKSYMLNQILYPKDNPALRIILGADVLKWEVQKLQEQFKIKLLVNNQVHDEGIVLYNRFRDPIIKETEGVNVAFEGRFSTIEELENNVFSLAKIKNAKVAVIDIHPLNLTCIFLRVLARDPYGKDPCPPLRTIIQAHKEIVHYRSSLIERVKKDPIISIYRLYWDNGGPYVIAEKRNGEFIQHKYLFLWPYSLVVKQQSDHIFMGYLNRQLTEEYIDWIFKKNILAAHSKYALYGWQGWVVARAIDYHSNGVGVVQAAELSAKNDILALYGGKAPIESYTNSWIREFPCLVEHIQAEHRYHIRGVDEMGMGLHFNTGTFPTKLNPEYNSENQIHVKLGYFIIPSTHADLMQTSTLSPEIKKELEAWDEDNQLLGYKLFVHPEAEEHYLPLLRAGFKYVTPLFSQYTGTPSSSYRTWIVRKNVTVTGFKWIDYFPEWMCLKNDPSPPFIVKFGVTSSSTDVTRLLPRCDVVKSIRMQEKFNQMELGPLTLFQENFGLSLKGINDYPPKRSKS